MGNQPSTPTDSAEQAEYTLFLKIDPALVNYQELAARYHQRAGYSGDVGVDLFFPQDHSVETNCLVGLGISCEMVRGDVDDPSFGIPIGYWLCARSSIAATPLFLQNGVGVIDAGYRGELKAAFAHHADLSHEHYIIRKLDRLVQIVAPNMGSIRVVIVDQLSRTERATRGFGSTGN